VKSAPIASFCLTDIPIPTLSSPSALHLRPRVTALDPRNISHSVCPTTRPHQCVGVLTH
jgi:hypothetical protein